MKTSFSRIASMLPLLLISNIIDARPLHYAAVDLQAVQACDDLKWVGDLDAAQNCYQALLQNNSSLASKAEASWALGDVQTANSLFEQASRAGEADSDQQSRILSRWGDLFLDTYQYQEALDLYIQASELSQSNHHAVLGAALALHESSDPIGAEQLSAFLENSSGNDRDFLGARLSALLTLAFIQIRSDNLDTAKEFIDRAEETAIEGEFPLQQVYALRAAYAIRDRADPMPFVEQALAINPHYGDAYAIPAFVYIITFKYD